MALYLGSTKAKSIKLGSTSVAFPPIGGSSPTEREFVRPNLTSNGTLGGSSFAVMASSEMTGLQAYKAVDSSTASYWSPASGDNLPSYTIFNPNPIKITKLDIRFSLIGRATLNSVYASDDNMNYTQIDFSSSGTSPIDVTLFHYNFYKYYKFVFNRRNSSAVIYVTNIAFTNAIEKVG